MLLAITLVLAFYLLWKIVRAPEEEDALGYLLVSPLLTIPIVMVGHSASSAIYTFDFALLLYAYRFVDLSHLNVSAIFKTLPGYIYISVICLLAIVSSLINWAFIEPNVWKFYAYCSIKYFEFAIMAFLAGTSCLRWRSIPKLAKPLIWGASLYGVFLLLDLLSVVPMGGVEYFTEGDTSAVWAAGDIQNWFMAGFKAQIAGNASVCLFAIVAFTPFIAIKQRLYVWLFSLIIFADVFLTTSRSDLAGLLAGIIAMLAAIGFSKGQWKGRLFRATICGVVLILLGGSVLWSRWDRKSQERISELWNSDLRATGSYADRMYDAKALPAYMVKMPVEALIGAGPGNYFRYANINVTRLGLGHNAYRSILGELGWFGLASLLGWCVAIGLACFRSLGGVGESSLWVAATAGLLIDRMVASWSADSLFAPMNMGGSNLFAIGIVYMLLRFKRLARHTATRRTKCA